MSGRSSSTCASRVDAVDQVGALGEPGRVVRVEVEVAAHARGRVDHDVDVAVADPLDHLAVERHVAGAGAGARVPHVHVHDGRARPGGGDAGRRRSAPGVTGTCSDLPTVSPAPVSAQ